MRWLDSFVALNRPRQLIKQNITNKTLALEIDIAYGRYMVDWHVSPWKSLFLQFSIYFELINVQGSHYRGIYVLLTESSLDDKDLRSFNIVIHENWKLLEFEAQNFCKFFDCISDNIFWYYSSFCSVLF